MSGLRFENKVAIVTGGCSGIGKGCAELLAENGGKVVVFDIQDDLGEKLQREGAGQITFMHCDMFKEDQIKTCVESVVSQFGQLDCIVNNVGVCPMEVESVGDFRSLLDINVVSHYAMYKHSLPHIRTTKGSVINISSTTATIGFQHGPTYAATKGAIISLSKSLAIAEAKYGVRINTIVCGGIQTPLLESHINKVEDPEERVQLGKENWGFMNVLTKLNIGANSKTCKNSRQTTCNWKWKTCKQSSNNMQQELCNLAGMVKLEKWD